MNIGGVVLERCGRCGKSERSTKDVQWELSGQRAPVQAYSPFLSVEKRYEIVPLCEPCLGLFEQLVSKFLDSWKPEEAP